MTVKELKSLLNEVDESLEVGVYSSMHEDGDMPYSAIVYDIEDLPYSKGDWPEFYGERILVIG